MSGRNATAEIERIRAVLTPRTELLEAYLFGSTARGDASAHSDVDVAVYVAPAAVNTAGFGMAADIAAAIVAALGRNEVDVVILNRASPILYHRVLRDGVRLLTRDLAATTVREGRALSRYCDYVPQLRKIEAVHRARIASGDFGR